MYFLGYALIVLITIPKILHATEDNKLVQTSASLQKQHKESNSEPNFPIVKDSNPNLAKKLANVKLGSSLRVRRENYDKEAVGKDLQLAEVETAEAAIDAEEAKDSSIEALLANSKLKQDLHIPKGSSDGSNSDSRHGGKKSSSKSSQSFSGSSNSSLNEGRNSENTDTEIVEIDEIDDDDDDEENEKIKRGNNDHEGSHYHEDEDEDNQEGDATSESADNNNYSEKRKHDANRNDEHVDDQEVVDSNDQNEGSETPSHETIVEDKNVGLTVKTVDFDAKSVHKQNGEGESRDKYKDKEQKHKSKNGGNRGIQNGGQDSQNEDAFKGKESKNHKDQFKGKEDERKNKLEGAKGKEESGGSSSDKKIGSGNICDGIVDLQRLSRDFKAHMKILVDREEEVVERLEQLGSSLENESARARKKTLARRNAKGPDDYIQPSTACVYIDENPGSNSNYHSTKGSNGNPSKKDDSRASHHQGAAGQDPADPNEYKEEIKVHVYTPEGVLPNLQIQPGGGRTYQHHQSNQRPYSPQSRDKGEIPVVEARYEPSQDSFAKRRHRRRHRSRKRVARGVKPDFKKESLDNLQLSQDIDLENIYWIKPSNPKSPQTSEAILNQIYKNGQDVLIVPISAKFRNIRDVANSFLDSVRIKANDVRGKTHELAQDMVNNVFSVGKSIRKKGQEERVKVHEWMDQITGSKHISEDNDEVMEAEKIT